MQKNKYNSYKHSQYKLFCPFSLIRLCIQILAIEYKQPNIYQYCRGSQTIMPSAFSSSKRISRLAQYLYDGSYEQAVQYHSQHKNQKFNDYNQCILLAKAYYLQQKYQQCLSLLSNVKVSSISSASHVQAYFQSQILKLKAEYLSGHTVTRDKIQKFQSNLKEASIKYPALINQYHQFALYQIKNITEKNILSKSSNFVSKQILNQEKQQFERLMKQFDDFSPIMEGMPLFLISEQWLKEWKSYVSCQHRVSMQNPGPISNFEIIDHIFNGFYDQKKSKHYTNTYLFEQAKFKLIPKQCWQFLERKYGGNQVKRFNISSISKPNEIMTEVYLKTIMVTHQAEMSKSNLQNNVAIWKKVQITKKQTFKGLIDIKLQPEWGKNGAILQFCRQSNELKRVNIAQILEDVDTVGKLYVYKPNQDGAVESSNKNNHSNQKCGLPKCKGTRKLQYCKCKSIKYCDIECLKQDRERHRKKCELQLHYINQKSAILSNFNLSQKSYSGRKGLVGLRNLGNTCYMNSGLQCLSNTKQITDYFMSNGFLKDINESNPLGTKGNLACAYAELMRQIWAGSDDVVSPFDLKKMIGKFATQFSGYGQQDSQQFISYLIDGLQQDLNLVKKKEPFETKDDIRPDQQASLESERNYAKRIQSYIRDLMAGQFKSTVECLTCKKISICFDPYLLLSLPIPTPKIQNVYLVTKDLSIGAIKLSFQMTDSTTFKQLEIGIFQTYRQIRKVIFLTLHEDTFEVKSTIYGDKMLNQPISSQNRPKQIIFCYQIPEKPQNADLWFIDYYYNKQIIGFPRYVIMPRNAPNKVKQNLIEQSFARGTNKKFEDIVTDARMLKQHSIYNEIPGGQNHMIVDFNKSLKLLTFRENRNFQLAKQNSKTLTLYDCLSAYSNTQVLEKQNQWYCNKCKSFMPAQKKIEIYKSNKILVLAFKRFSRFRKIRTLVDFPLEGLDMGPFLKSNKQKKSILYDLYGVVNHFGSLGGGHYTAYCQNFLNKRWYEFNDSRVSDISKREIVSGDSYVLFFRRRD